MVVHIDNTFVTVSSEWSHGVWAKNDRHSKLTDKLSAGAVDRGATAPAQYELARTDVAYASHIYPSDVK